MGQPYVVLNYDHSEFGRYPNRDAAINAILQFRFEELQMAVKHNFNKTELLLVAMPMQIINNIVVVGSDIRFHIRPI